MREFTITTPDVIADDITQICAHIQFKPTGTQGATAGAINIYGAKLEIGSTFTGWLFPDYESTLRKCQRYYEKSFDITTAPGVGVTQPGTHRYGGGVNSTETDTTIFFKVSKRAAPTIVTWSNGTGGNNATHYHVGGIGDFVNGVASCIGTNSFNFTGGQAYTYAKLLNWEANAEL